MLFYNLRIKNSSSVNHAATGKFCGHELPDIIVSRGRILEMFTVDLSRKNVCSLLAIDFNAMIRSLAPIRRPKKDLIAVTSDAGKLVILEFVLEGRYFKTVLDHRFEYEIKFSHRFTPGEYLAVHQESKTIAIGALEEGVMLYDVSKVTDMGRGDFNNPLKITKPRYILYDLVEVCSNSEHPLFASLEVRYPKTKSNKSASKDTDENSECGQPGTSKQSESIGSFKQKSSADILKSRIFASLTKEFGQFLSDKTADKIPPMVLVFYDWNLKTKNVDMSEVKLKRHANKLISVPVGNCHKEGVIICFCNEIEFVEAGTFEKAHCFIPQRKNVAFNNEKGMLISGWATYKKEDKFLLFLQSEEGDLFSTEISRVDKKLKIKMTYVDTIPVASALCIIEGEFLFLGAHFGDHFLYKIKSLGSDDEFTPFRDITQLFTARKVENLEICAKLEGLVPVLKCIAPYPSSSRYSISKSPVHQQTDNANNNTLQLYFACGMGPSSTLRTFKHGVKVQEDFSFDSFYEDMFIQRVWAFRQLIEDKFKTLIVVSGTSKKNATAVFTVDDKVEISDSGFQLTSETLNCVQVEIDTIVQVLPYKVRYICQENMLKEHVIKCICKKKEKPSILKSAAHKNQLAVALQCKEIICAEVIKSEDGTIDLKERRIMPESTAVAMEFIPCEPKSEYLVVCFKDSIHIYSLGLKDVSSIAEQSLASVPSSLVCNQMNGNGLICFINIGFEDGSLMKLYLNEKNEIKKSFSLKLDSKRIELIKLNINNDDAILAISNQAWISFNCKTKFNLVPLLYNKLFCAANFFPTDMCPEANLIAVRKIEKKDKNEEKDRKLVFLCVKDVVSLFTESLQQLDLTPRQILWNSENEMLVISQSDYRPPSYKDGDVTPQMAMELTLGVSKHKAPDPKAEYLNQMVRNRPPSKYDCGLFIFNPVHKKFVFNGISPLNHVIVRLCLVEFASRNELYLLASGKKCILLYPEEKYENFVHTYKITDDGESFEQIDKADMVDAPSAMCPFEGYVLIGVKNKLWLCDFEEKLILKFSVEMPCNISDVYAQQNFYVVLCEHRNVIYGFWNKDENKLENVHEDKHLGSLSTLCFLNDDIMVAADMSGYLIVVLLPAIPSSADEEDVKESTSSRPVQESTEKNISISRFRFTSNSFVLVKHYVGEIVTSLQKTSFLEKARKVILYVTLSGTVGVLVPFLNETADRIFEPLQYILKIKSFYHNEGETECMEAGKDIYSLFEDQQNMKVIDGNVCDIFHTLSDIEQKEVAGCLKKEPFEINEILAEMKAKIYFYTETGES